MDDKKQIEQLYQDMYAAMVKKDEAELDRVHDDTFYPDKWQRCKNDRKKSSDSCFKVNPQCY